MKCFFIITCLLISIIVKSQPTGGCAGFDIEISFFDDKNPINISDTSYKFCFQFKEITKLVGNTIRLSTPTRDYSWSIPDSDDVRKIEIIKNMKDTMIISFGICSSGNFKIKRLEFRKGYYELSESMFRNEIFYVKNWDFIESYIKNENISSFDFWDWNKSIKEYESYTKQYSDSTGIVSKGWYSSGEIRSITYQINDSTFSSVLYYENGSVWSIFSYVSNYNGFYNNGFVYEFYNNGQIHYMMNWIHGHAVGKTIFYDENGKVYKIEQH